MNEFLFKEAFKLSLNLASATLGILLLSGVIALPLPAIALLAVGVCLASAGTLLLGINYINMAWAFLIEQKLIPKKTINLR
ncbi:MAG: hypothetical protein EBQ95_03545 [Gammaproteobacteria bacterium]|nr:hypothetical protein [Gammaproteobacteria bacterium]